MLWRQHSMRKWQTGRSLVCPCSWNLLQKQVLQSSRLDLQRRIQRHVNQSRRMSKFMPKPFPPLLCSVCSDTVAEPKGKHGLLSLLLSHPGEFFLPELALHLLVLCTLSLKVRHWLLSFFSSTDIIVFLPALRL